MRTSFAVFSNCFILTSHALYVYNCTCTAFACIRNALSMARLVLFE
jgi:hypothetical protein